MAKSKTQKAKASARRAEKKKQAQVEQATPVVVEETPEKKSFNPLSKLTKKKPAEEAPAKKSSKAEPKKQGFFARKFGFLKDVRAELRRVTWPSRVDVIRWSGVVVVALLFFSLYVFVLDNWIVTPLLVAISSLGA